MKKNKFSKALKHLKSKKLDEKIKKLDEAAPTNSMSGVYQVTPRADSAFRLGELDPPRRFVAPADGNWPAGIPGTAGEPYYERPAGYWKGAVDWETITEPKFGHNAAQSNNTDGLIDPDTNVVKTHLPPNSRSFILGPLVDGFVPNHLGDAFTRIGYIEKDTRQFVLLGIIQGEWIAGLNEVISGFGGGTYPVFNGQSNQFTQVNPNFTLDMALWFRNEMLKGRFVKNVSYNAVGGVPQLSNQDPDAPQPLGGNGVGGGSGAAGENPDGTGEGTGSGGNPTTGTEQGDPDDNDIESLELWGINYNQQNPKPKPEDYPNVRSYRRALAKWNREKRAAEQEFKNQQSQGQSGTEEKSNIFSQAFDFVKNAYKSIENAYDEFIAKNQDAVPTQNVGSAIDYNLSLASSLLGSVITGNSKKLKLSDGARKGLIKSIDPDKFFDALVIGPPPEPNAENAIRPGKGKTEGVLTGSWGAQGGSEFHYNPNNGTLTITSNKMLRDMGELDNLDPNWDKWATGTVTDLDDIPNKSPEDIKALFNKVPGLSDNIEKFYKILVAGMADDSPVLGNLSKEDAVDAMNEGYPKILSAIYNYSVEGTAYRAIQLRNQLIKAGAPKTELEKENGGFGGHVYSQEVFTGNDLPKEIRQAIIDKYVQYDSAWSNVKAESYTGDKKRILREIRQPLKEIKQLPKTQKLKGYRPNFKGKYSPQNTPDVTASKRSDQLVMAKNAEGQAWTVGDKYQKGWETTGRMNHVYARVGESNKFFEEITSNNSADVDRKMQEHLNHVYHNKAMLKIDSNYKSPFIGDDIDESETYDNKINDPLFTKVAKRLKKEIDYPKKPAAKGYPNEAPPKIDPNSGYHPKFGKRYKYDKLDPISAKTMAGAPTGDPEIDANVKKAAKIKESWRSDLKNLWLGSEREDWKKKIEEDFVNTTQGMKVGQTFTHVSGQTVTTGGALGGVESVPPFVEIFGDIAPAPSESQYGLQGFAKPIDIMRRGKKKTEQLNKELDSSEEYTKKIKADEYMKARVTGELSLEQKKEFVEIYKNNLEEWNKKSEARGRENERRRKSNISKVRSFVSKFGAILDDMKGFETFMKITQGGKKLVVVHQNNVFRDYSDKFNVTVYEAAKGKRISKIRGSFGKVTRGMFDNPFTKGKSSGQATIMYDGIGGEVESKTFVAKELPPIPMPTPPKFMQKNIDKGWQPSVTSSFDQEFINKMNIWFNTLPKIYSSTVENFTSGANFPAQLAINLAKGNLDPVTESPGRAVSHIIKKNIEFVLSTGKTEDLRDFDGKGNKLDPELKKHHSFFNPITGKGAVRYNAYKDFGVTSAPVSASLGQYSIERTDKGIRIADTYDISGGFTAPGGADFFSGLTKLIGGRDVQLTGETLTAIAARRAAELGYDMVDADTGETLKPVYSGEEEYNSRIFKNDPNAPTIATPKGYNIKIDFTIPWDSFSPETATLLKIGGKEKVDPLSNNKSKQVVSKEPSKAVQTVKNMASSKSVGFDRDDLSFKKKKNFREWSQQLDDMWNSDWRDELKEGMTTSDTFSYSKPGRGDTDLATTGTGYQDGIHQLQNIPPMETVDDPHLVGKALGGGPIGAGYQNVYGGINQYTGSTQERDGIENHYWNNAVDGTTLDDNNNPRYSDYIYPFDREATGAEIQTAKDASQVRGANDVFRATYPTNVFANRHKATPVATNPTVGVDDDYDTVGLGVRYGGAYDTRTPRFFVPAAVNTSEIDTVKILASVPVNNQGIAVMTQAGSQLQLFYWAGDKPGFQSLQNKFSHPSSDYPNSNRQYDGWRPIAQKPNGEIDSSVSSNIIDIQKPVGFQGGKVSEFTLQIPEWCRSTNTRFMLIQMSSSNGGPTIYSIRYQRRNALTINTTLADEKASAFVRVGNNSQMSPEDRKKKLNDMLKASREYMIKSLGFASLFNDEVKISDVVSSNLDFMSVMQGDGKYGNARFHDIIDADKKRAAEKKYTTRPRTRRG